MWRKSSPNLIVWFDISLVKTVANSTVRSERSHGRLAAKPMSGSLQPLALKLIRVMPLVHSSMFAPRMPSSCAVVKPSPADTAVLWK